MLPLFLIKKTKEKRKTLLDDNLNKENSLIPLLGSVNK